MSEAGDRITMMLASHVPTTAPAMAVAHGHPTIEDLMSQIERSEGFREGTLAWRNNNPGNLAYAGQEGAVRGERGFAKWPDANAGREGLRRQLLMILEGRSKVYSPETTLMEFFKKYDQTKGNKPRRYAEDVAKKLSVTTGFRLKDFQNEGNKGTGGQGND